MAPVVRFRRLRAAAVLPRYMTAGGAGGGPAAAAGGAPPPPPGGAAALATGGGRLRTSRLIPPRRWAIVGRMSSTTPGPSPAAAAERVGVGIVGVSGYSGIELARLLARHPRFRPAFVTSDRWAGRRLGERIA